MSDFTGLKVEQIKIALLVAGMPEADIAELKGKAAFVEAAKNLGINPDDIAGETELVGSLAKAELESEEAPLSPDIDPIVETNKPPKRSSAEWHDYVFSQFTSNELFNDLPTINGLRRLSLLLLGEPIFSGCVDLKVFPGSGPNDPGRATCVYEVTYGNGHAQCSYRGVGGSFVGNTNDEYAAFPESIAETRAESRALRKALGLNVNSAEEITQKNTASVISDFVTESTGEYKDESGITPSQVRIITKMCDDLKVDVLKFINKKFFTGLSPEPQFKSIDDVPRAVAGSMIAELNKYQTQTDVSKDIPKEILV